MRGSGLLVTRSVCLQPQQQSIVGGGGEEEGKPLSSSSSSPSSIPGALHLPSDWLPARPADCTLSGRHTQGEREGDGEGEREGDGGFSDGVSCHFLSLSTLCSPVIHPPFILYSPSSCTVGVLGFFCQKAGRGVPAIMRIDGSGGQDRERGGVSPLS